MNPVLDTLVPPPTQSWEAAGTTGAATSTLRPATPDDGPGILALIMSHREEGHLLPRTLSDITMHAHRFLVAHRDGVIVACAELAPLGEGLAEVRSLVVDASERGAGLGRDLVGALWQRGAAAGFRRLCAFTHSPAWFVRMGFSLVPHVWLSEKVLTDCVHCPLFRTCGQYAVVAAIGAADGHAPAGSARPS